MRKTSRWAGRLTNFSSISAGTSNFSLLQIRHTCLRIHPTSFQSERVALSVGAKWLGRQCDHYPPFYHRLGMSGANLNPRIPLWPAQG
jgi:hypothetical protein